MKTVEVSFIAVNLFFKNTTYLPNFVKNVSFEPGRKYIQCNMSAFLKFVIK